MRYDLSLFRTFSKEHQLRVLYKMMRVSSEKAVQLVDSELLEYTKAINNQQLLEVVREFQESGKKRVDFQDEMLSRLEQLLGITVRDDQFIETQDIEPQKDDFSKSQFHSQRDDFTIVLHNLRSAFNVGSILRSSECFGVDQVILTGYTPSPENQRVKSTAMGTSEYIRWSKESLEKILRMKKDIPLIGFETTSSAVSLSDFSFPQKCALFFGNERFGIDDSLLGKLDSVVKIPMLGGKNSLNVASALAIAAYEYRRQWPLARESLPCR